MIYYDYLQDKINQLLYIERKDNKLNFKIIFKQQSFNIPSFDCKEMNMFLEQSDEELE